MELDAYDMDDGCITAAEGEESTSNLLENFRALADEARELRPSTVPTLPAPPPALHFYREFVAPGNPCILDNFPDWPAHSKWNAEYLSCKLGDSGT